MTDWSSDQRAGQASAHAMQTHLWVETLVHDLAALQTELNSTKDELKTSRSNNLLWRDRVTDLESKSARLESKVTGLEGKLIEAQNLYTEAQQVGLETKDKLEKQIAELKLQVAEEERRANRAEASWFTQGHDDRIRAAKEAGLEYKKILIDPRFNPCETESSADESDQELGPEDGGEN